MSRFSEIKQGLVEAIQYEQKSLQDVTVHHGKITGLATYSPADIKSIRIKANMTQRVFAAVVGVSIKTVEAWEGGRSKPDGAARRLLGLIDNNPNFAVENKIIIID